MIFLESVRRILQPRRRLIDQFRELWGQQLFRLVNTNISDIVVISRKLQLRVASFIYQGENVCSRQRTGSRDSLEAMNRLSGRNVHSRDKRIIHRERSTEGFRLVKHFVISAEAGSELSVESETDRETVSRCTRKMSTHDRKSRNFLLLIRGTTLCGIYIQTRFPRTITMYDPL